MKATLKGESGKPLGFWGRLGSALAGMDMSSVDFLELRIERLEHQVARLLRARDRQSTDTSPPADQG
jgi:hypothetical protein